MRRGPLLLFFASGFVSLVLESVWIRRLGLVFGNTVEATATVLAVFMAGLALGSHLLGRWLDRTQPHPLRAYAALEAGLAVAALALAPLMDGLDTVYRPLYAALGPGPALAAARTALAACLLLPPTVLMGGTFPALARLVVARPEQARRRLGVLYAVNAAGAACGAWLSGFALLPGLGVAGTNRHAVLVGLAVAASAALLAMSTVPPSGDPVVEDAAEGSPLPEGLVPLALFGTGAAGLALEVVSFRVLVEVLGSTVYALAMMLGVFLAGIAAGSALVARAPHARPRLRQLGWVVLGTAAAVAAMAWTTEALPRIYLAVLARLGVTFGADLVARAVASLAFLGPAVLGFGAAFPLGAALETRRLATLGSRVGRVYAANTLGAIAGSLAAGFVLLPRLGSQHSLVAIATGLAVLGGLLVVAVPGRRWAAIALATAIGVAALAAPPWGVALLAEGVYMNPAAFLGPDGRSRLDEAVQQHRVLYAAEGATATVVVLDSRGELRSLRIDGKSEMSTAPEDARLGRMAGHLPALLHPAPRRGLVIGLGAGLTVAALAAHPFERIDVVEIEPAVVGAARAFSAENRRVLDDPRVRVTFGDGRSLLRLTDQRWDVITSDPFEPTVAGAASLFTVEHYRAARARLLPGGIFAQWLPLYELGYREADSIVRSFATAFPSVGVWFTGNDALLIGAEVEPRVDGARLERALARPGVAADLAEVGLDDPWRLLATFLFRYEREGPEASAPLNLDARPYVEFAAPTRRWLPTIEVHAERWRERHRPHAAIEALSGPLRDAARLRYDAMGLAIEAKVLSLRGQTERAAANAREALRLDPGNPWARHVLAQWRTAVAEAALQAGRSDLAAQEFAAAIEAESTPTAHLGLARARLAAGDPEGARAAVEACLARWPDSLGGRLLLAETRLRQGQEPEARRLLGTVLADFPRSREAHALAERIGPPAAAE